MLTLNIFPFAKETRTGRIGANRPGPTDNIGTGKYPRFSTASEVREF
jgi:hypothetical protein